MSGRGTKSARLVRRAVATLLSSVSTVRETIFDQGPSPAGTFNCPAPVRTNDATRHTIYMERESILNGIQRRATFDSQWEAERAVLATLRTLGEYVSEKQVDKLATRLPPQFGDALTERSGRSPRSYSVDGFVVRVAQREGRDVSTTEALVHVRATLATLADLDLQVELAEVRKQLPEEFETLFGTRGLRAE